MRAAQTGRRRRAGLEHAHSGSQCLHISFTRAVFFARAMIDARRHASCRRTATTTTTSAKAKGDGSPPSFPPPGDVWPPPPSWRCCIHDRPPPPAADDDGKGKPTSPSLPVLRARARAPRSCSAWPSASARTEAAHKPRPRLDGVRPSFDHARLCARHTRRGGADARSLAAAAVAAIPAAAAAAAPPCRRRRRRRRCPTRTTPATWRRSSSSGSARRASRRRRTPPPPLATTTIAARTHSRRGRCSSSPSASAKARSARCTARRARMARRSQIKLDIVRRRSGPPQRGARGADAEKLRPPEHRAVPRRLREGACAEAHAVGRDGAGVGSRSTSSGGAAAAPTRRRSRGCAPARAVGPRVFAYRSQDDPSRREGGEHPTRRRRWRKLADLVWRRSCRMSQSTWRPRW